MKNKRILVFTLLMSALLVFSAMPAYSFEEIYLGAESGESGTAIDSSSKADNIDEKYKMDASTISAEPTPEEIAATTVIGVTGTVSNSSTLLTTLKKYTSLVTLSFAETTFSESSVTLNLGEFTWL
ncbi:MAG: hypothetical protein IJ597_00420, partial [Synergistaceae bacterium]|nr:hypothetical protein [Synergistaceae bacterium]